MRTRQISIKSISTIESEISQLTNPAPDCLFVFGGLGFFTDPIFKTLFANKFPSIPVIGCSTAGEISGERVYDDYCIVTAVNFSDTKVSINTTPLENMLDSHAAGERLANSIAKENLSAVFVIGTGVAINGSALVAGLQENLPTGTSISGGLAADSGAFKETWTIGPAGVTNNHIVTLAFYGNSINLQYGTFAGWEPFGPARKVTKCEENVLYELDGERALDIYKRYLGDYAKDLPGSGLLFPFEMLGSNQEQHGIFRTILGVDETSGSLTLAGDIDPNGYLKLMHSSTDKLISGAEVAAKIALKEKAADNEQSLAILVSCIGRKLVMGDRVDEEVEVVGDIFGKNTAITGFYSNGEIAGTQFHENCHLHNQTMTITLISEH